MGSITLPFILTKDPKLVTMVEDMFGPVLMLGTTVHGLALDLGEPCEFVAVCDPGRWTVKRPNGGATDGDRRSEPANTGELSEGPNLEISDGQEGVLCG